MNKIKIIAFTHKTVGVDSLGKLHIDQLLLKDRLEHLKTALNLSELMYISTCNRVEFVFVTGINLTKEFVERFINEIYQKLDKATTSRLIENAQMFEGESAVMHLFNVAASLDSLVVGEREIITQVRNSFDQSRKWKLSGDLIRLVIRKTIESAKEVYTKTGVSKNPVSVVSLAYRKLKNFNVPLDARFLIIGSGVTNVAMAKYLKKHGFKNFTVFNRTLENAKQLAGDLNANAYSLNELNTFNKGFDVIVSCTGAAETIITKEIYQTLINGDKSRKVVIDLAVPNDLDPDVLNDYDVNLIAVNNLRDVANENLKQREKELLSCKEILDKNFNEFRQILKERKVELAMQEVPKKVREIKELALSEVFAKDINMLDDRSKEVLDKVLSYMEKKYNTVTMKMAKEIIIDSAVEKE